MGGGYALQGVWRRARRAGCIVKRLPRIVYVPNRRKQKRCMNISTEIIVQLWSGFTKAVSVVSSNWAEDSTGEMFI